MVYPVVSSQSFDASPVRAKRLNPAFLNRWQKWSKALPQGLSRLTLPRPKHPHLWGLGAGSFALGLVNGALVVSAGAGVVAYQQLLQLSPRQRQRLVQGVQRGLPLPTSPQQQTLALGLLTGASTYTLTSLWHSTQSLPMALLLTGQGALALFALGMLVKGPRSTDRRVNLWDASPLTQMEHNLAILSHSDPLKRLVAVRRLTRLAEQGAMDGDYLAEVSVRSHLIDCFHLMLTQEPEPIVRSALREGLTLLHPAPSLPQGSEPLPDPPTQASAPKAAAEPGRRATVDYVEYLEI